MVFFVKKVKLPVLPLLRLQSFMFFFFNKSVKHLKGSEGTCSSSFCESKSFHWLVHCGLLVIQKPSQSQSWRRRRLDHPKIRNKMIIIVSLQIYTTLCPAMLTPKLYERFYQIRVCGFQTTNQTPLTSWKRWLLYKIR